MEHLGAHRPEGRRRAKLTSPQIERQQDMPAGRRSYIAAAGGAVIAGTPVQLTIAGLPHHSALPRNIALVALAVAVLGVWLGGRHRLRSRLAANASN